MPGKKENVKNDAIFNLYNPTGDGATITSTNRIFSFQSLLAKIIILCSHLEKIDLCLHS